MRFASLRTMAHNVVFGPLQPPQPILWLIPKLGESDSSSDFTASMRHARA
jgi:hypothetical protein